MYGKWALAIGLAYCNKSPRLSVICYRKLLRFLALRVHLVIFASAVVAGSTLVSCLFASRCPVCPAIRKSGCTTPVPCGSGPSGARSLGDGVGQGI